MHVAASIQSVRLTVPVHLPTLCVQFANICIRRSMQFSTAVPTSTSRNWSMHKAQQRACFALAMLAGLGMQRHIVEQCQTIKRMHIVQVGSSSTLPVSQYYTSAMKTVHQLLQGLNKHETLQASPLLFTLFFIPCIWGPDQQSLPAASKKPSDEPAPLDPELALLGSGT